MNARYFIGIDTGVNTGFSIWDSEEKKFVAVKSLPIHKAMQEVEHWNNHHYLEGVFVRIEDARLAVHGRTKSNDFHKLQGAGSIKRDAKIWEDFLGDIGVAFEMVRPQKSMTKMKQTSFMMLTKWKEQTNSHSRDAAMLVFGM